MSSFSDVDAASGPMRLDRKDKQEGAMLEVRYPNVQVRITEEYPWGYDGEDEEFYTRIPHLAQTSDVVNRQLSCFSSRYMNLLAVFQI